VQWLRSGWLSPIRLRSSALNLEDAGTENRRKAPLTWGAFLLSSVVTKT
jgi:hypothetical protein